MGLLRHNNNNNNNKIRDIVCRRHMSLARPFRLHPILSDAMR
jgi:hypothetical protein